MNTVNQDSPETRVQAHGQTKFSASKRKVNLSNIGAILAVVISFVALIHTIVSDRQLRECNFLYNKNDRLVELKTRINDVEELVSGLRFESDEVLAGGDMEAMREMIVKFITTQIDSAQDLYQLFDVYQYAFSREDIEMIEVHIQHLEKTHEDHKAQAMALQQDAFIRDVHDRTSGLVEEMKRVSDHELTIVANRLRDSCST